MLGVVDMKSLLFICLITLLGMMPQTAAAQWIYYSTCPGECELESCYYAPLDTAYIYVHAPGNQDIVGAHFRLETSYFGPGDVTSLDPGPGVSIEDGDLFQGMTLALTPLDLTHYPALRIVADQPFLGNHVEETWGYRIRDALLFRSDGDTLVLETCFTFAGHVDCWDALLGWMHSDTVDVFIGTQSTVTFKCWISSPGIIGTNYEITDEMDWVIDWNPKAVGGSECMVCPWEDQTTLITVLVPQSTPARTVSKLTIRPTYHVFVSDSTTFFLRAIPPISTREETWGRIKVLYRGKGKK